MADISWQDDAPCRGLDVTLFFGQDREQPHDRAAREAAAKEICRSCPVRTQCLDYAIKHAIRYGLWGGMNEDERFRERRRRLRQASAA
jgi:WhiB family transcriptional regulator, redox-sensing transcriptional regulator